RARARRDALRRARRPPAPRDRRAGREPRTGVGRALPRRLEEDALRRRAPPADAHEQPDGVQHAREPPRLVHDRDPGRPRRVARRDARRRHARRRRDDHGAAHPRAARRESGRHPGDRGARRRRARRRRRGRRDALTGACAAPRRAAPVADSAAARCFTRSRAVTVVRMSRLWRYLRRYAVRYAGGIACLIGATTLVMAVPWLFKEAVDAMGRGEGAGVVLRYAAMIVAIAVVQGVVRTFSRFVIFNVGRDIEYDLRNDLFRHLESMPLAFYQQRQTGDLMSRLVNDVTAVRMLLGPGILNFINTPVYYVYGLAIMLS